MLPFFPTSQLSQNFSPINLDSFFQLSDFGLKAGGTEKKGWAAGSCFRPYTEL